MIIVFAATYSIITYSISNFVEYGQFSNPCVDLEIFQKSGRSMNELYFNEKFDCYSTKQLD